MPDYWQARGCATGGAAKVGIVATSAMGSGPGYASYDTGALYP